MSGQVPEAAEPVELPPQGDSAFSTLMDTLVADEASQEGGAPEAGPAPDGGGEPPAAGGEAPGTGGEAEQPASDAAPGDEGAPAGDPEQPAAVADAGDRPAAWTADASTFIPKLGALSTALEENTTKAYQATALQAVQEEHKNYFEALKKHPRLLVGTDVPAIGKEGTERLRDTADAREWQEAVKSILVEEVNDRAGREVEANRDFLQTVHASIEMFQANPDLIPGTKNFNVDLANRFTKMAKPYEIRVDGKLQGYSIPVQPIIDDMRSAMAAARTTPAAPAAGAPPADPPQAGISSKTGSGTASEDFSTLFGTLGMPDFRI